MDNYYLSIEEILIVMLIIKQTRPGLHRLKDLPGRFWNGVDRKTKYGARFKRTAEDGRLPGVRLFGRTVQNHHVYEIGSLPAVL